MPNAKTPTDHQAKAYGGWKKTSLHDLDLPSGAIAQVKRPGLQGLLRAGVLDDLDTLTAVVATETIPKAEGKPVGAKSDTIESDKMISALEAMDKIICFVVVQPEVLPSTRPELDDDGNPTGETESIPDEERDPDAYYVDDVDITDKSFIVSFAMGASKDLETFRAATEKSVGSVPAGA